MKQHSPVTPSSRSLITTDRSTLWKGSPLKKLSFGASKTGGRNNFGRITCRSRGGGHKRLHRVVDFKRRKLDVPAVVQRIEYDPDRTAFLALIRYEDGELSYILATQNMKAGDFVVSSDRADISDGNCLTLEFIPIGSNLHNIELKPGKGGQIARSAGAFAQLIGKSGGYAQVKLSSSEFRLIHLSCRATIGIVANVAHKNESLGKAGRNRWKGFRPTVRGVAMNPVDHPHGGGEGRTSGGRHPVTPWGKCTKGKKTRSNKRTSSYIIRRRSR